MPRSPEPPVLDFEKMYQCPECETVTEERRCDDCNKFTVAIWAVECPKCGEYISDADL